MCVAIDPANSLVRLRGCRMYQRAHQPQQRAQALEQDWRHGCWRRFRALANSC